VRNTVSVIVARCAVALRQVLIFHSDLEIGAVGELANMRPVYFLPGRLAKPKPVAAW
jgi:hypothetical protein